MRVTLLILCFILFGFPRCALAVPGPTVHSKDVVIEKRLLVLGLPSPEDADILEVDGGSNLKGDVHVGKDLLVAQNITVDQGVTITQGLTVGENLEVGGNVNVGGNLEIEDLHVQGDLEVDENSNLKGDITFDGLGKAMSFVNDLRVRLSSVFAKRFGETIRGSLVDYVTYDPDVGSWSFNGAKALYDPTDGWNFNDGSLRINSTNNDKDMEVFDRGEVTFQRGENNESCALILKENPNVTEGIELLQVEGKSRFTNAMRIESGTRKRVDEPLLVVEGDVEIMGILVSSDDIRSYAVDTDVTMTTATPSTLGQTFSATASCSPSKVIMGGGCTITGLSTGLVLKQSAPSGKNYLCQYVQSLKEFNEFFNETIPVAIDATITATVFCATSIA